MRVAFFGTPKFGCRILEALIDAGEDIVLVVTQPDRPRQRRGRGPLEPSPVKRLAAERGLPTLTPEQTSELQGELERISPDVCVVAAYGQILPERLLATAGGRWVNVHASLLPEYRGASPITQAILDGRNETGVTIMEVVPALDAGPVLAAATVPISATDTTGSLSEKLAAAGGSLLVKTLPDYTAGALKPRPQNEAAATMTKTIKKDDGRIDWSRDAAYLARFTRAMQPWPGAWTTLGDARIVVTAARAEPGSAKPGTFDAAPPLRVGTADGTLVIDRVKPAGKPEMDGSAWLNGVRQPGHFGS